jgi:CDGSH-type Zn-finger protein
MTALPQSPNVTLKAIHNGPYQIKGPIQLVDHDGRSYDLTGRRSVLLCRCGHSANKPLCDGSHARLSFHAAERAQVPETAAESSANLSTA